MKQNNFFITILILVCFLGVAGFSFAAEKDSETGLIMEKGYEMVKETCTVCHTAQLITQNRADRAGWLEMIRWMQEKQGLWELEPEMEKGILDYLATNYGPLKSFRRPPLNVEWK